MVFYIPKREKLHQDGIGDYVAYGIVCFEIGGSGIKKRCQVSDVTFSPKAAFQLALDCTLGQLDPKQLLDVAEDFIFC